MEFSFGFVAAAVLGFLAWHFFPRIKQVETKIFIGVMDEVAHLKDDAEKVVKQVQADFAQAGGEAKAHQALALLMKLRPEALKADIRLAIELAVRTCLGQ